MKVYKLVIISIILGFFSGILELYALMAFYEDSFSVYELIDYLGRRYAEYKLVYMGELVYKYIPMLFFHVFFGTAIYKNFCVAGIYYFTRTEKINSWIIKEFLKVALASILFSLGILVGGACYCKVRGQLTVEWNIDTLLLGISFIVLTTLFMYISTILINVVALLSESGFGFVLSEMFILFNIVVFCAYGDVFGDYHPTDKYAWVMKINPFRHLIFLFKTEPIHYYKSVIYFCILAVGISIIMALLIRTHEFISNNQEIDAG